MSALVYFAISGRVLAAAFLGMYLIQYAAATTSGGGDE